MKKPSHTVTVVVILSVAILCHCNKKGNNNTSKSPAGAKTAKAGAKTAKAAVKGFMAAVAKGDVDSAGRFIMNDSACTMVPAKACKEYVKRIRQELPNIVKDLPKGFKMGKVELKPMPGVKETNVQMAHIHPKGGGRPVPMMVMKIKDRYYVGFGIAHKSKKSK